MYPNTLPQVSGEVFLTGSGLVNDLVFNEKFDLSEPASFVLVDDAESRVALEVYFRRPDGHLDLPTASRPRHPCQPQAGRRRRTPGGHWRTIRVAPNIRHGLACRQVRFGGRDG